MNKLISLIATMVLLSGCATTPPVQPLKETASGRPEAVFRNTTLSDARGKIIAGCAAKGFMPEPQENAVVCSKRMEGSGAVMTQMLLGNSYSTPPMTFARIILTQNGSDVFVIVYQWVETQMAFGQVNKAEIVNVRANNSVYEWLFSMGAE